MQVVSLHPPSRREDWSLALPGIRWSSVRAGGVTPAGWHAWVGPSVLLLKGTGTFGLSLLDDGVTVLYEIPRSAPRAAAPSATCLALHREADALCKRVECRLFATESARNYYLGEYCVERIERAEGAPADGATTAGDGAPVERASYPRTFVRLRRLAAQDERVVSKYSLPSDGRCARSRSEERHAKVIALLLPGWRLLHEPECVSFFESELVVDGRRRGWGGDQYTCDYVAAAGSARVCIESKASSEGMDEVARLRCRALRDRSLARVIALVDHGARMWWHDFGCPAHANEVGEAAEAWGTDLLSLRARLV